MEEEKKDTKLMIIIAIAVMVIIGIIGFVAVVNSEENVIKKRIIGKWSTTIVSMAGVNDMIFTFNPDNTVVMEYRGNKRNGTYEIDTNKKEINASFKYEYVENPDVRHIQYTYDTGKVEDLILVDKSSDYTTNNKLEKIQ